MKCDICGKKISFGYMTTDCGDVVTHEGKCFTKMMNKTYGKHRWMALGNGDQDEFGGFYIAAADVAGGIQGTGLYYTELEESNE